MNNVNTMQEIINSLVLYNLLIKDKEHRLI